MQVRLSILNGSATGGSVYSEVRAVTTNAVGLFVIQIGSGGAVSTTGNLATVNWTNGSKFLKVEIDPLGGSSFIELGTNQLVSVPYALSATPSGAAGGDLTGSYPNPTLAINSVTTQKIADLSVTFMKLSDQAVTTAKLADGSVTDIKIQSVSGSKVTGNIPGNAVNVTGTVALANGGTGATTAAGARTNLGLDKIDNTSDANKPISTLTQAALDLKAPLASPTFTGAPTLPTGTVAVTQTPTDNSTNIATTAFVQKVVAVGAPDATTTATGKVQLAGDLGGTGSTATAPVITDAAITTPKIADASVTNEKLANESVSNDKIISVSGSKVAGDITGNAANVNGIVSIANGGTGAKTVAGARTNLGLVIGTDVVAANATITGATKTKITYDAKGLVTAGADATTADIAPSTNRNYVTDVQAGVISNTSGVNTGDQTISLTGDVTGSGTGTFTTTIGAGKVTNAMLAGSIAASKLVGTDITTVGTITTGTWSATTIALANGGTGATTASAARTNLGLGNIDNTSDANKPISTLTQAALDLKAPLASPTFTGTPTLPTGTIAVTQSPTDNSTKLATTAFVQNTVATGAPDATTTTTGKVQLAGDLGGTGSTAAAPVISNAAITTVKIADANVTTAKLADASITTTKLAAGSVSTTSIIDAAVTDAKIVTVSGTKVTGNISGNAANVTGTVAIANGGTGATTAAGARTNLGLVIGTDVVAANATITGATKTKITYDAKGLVTAGADATTADIAPSTNRNYVTDVQSAVLSNTSGTNTGDQTITLTGDITGSGTGTFSATLANSGVTPGTYGSSTAIPSLTIDSKGRVTTATTTSITAGVNTVGAIAASSNAKGATISGTTIFLTPADATNGGIVTASTQTIAGDKNFTGGIRGKAALSSEITADLTITSANASDYNSKILICNPSSGPITITFNSGLPDGFNCMVLQKSIDANMINFAGGTSVTMKNRQNYTATAGNYALATIVHIGGDIIVTAGDMQ